MNQPWGDSQTCTSCGKCFMACPTGAIFSKGSTVAEMEHGRAKLDFLGIRHLVQFARLFLEAEAPPAAIEGARTR